MVALHLARTGEPVERGGGMKQLVTKGAYIVKTGNEFRWEWDGDVSLPCESFDKCLVWLLVARSGCRTAEIMPLTRAIMRGRTVSR